MKCNQIFELIVNDLKLFTNEFFKEENVSILVDVIETVDIGTQRATNLPAISAFQTI